MLTREDVQLVCVEKGLNLQEMGLHVSVCQPILRHAKVCPNAYANSEDSRKEPEESKIWSSEWLNMHIRVLKIDTYDKSHV